MTPERWQQVKAVLEEALELAPEQRPAFLDSACSSDHSLRGEVESLLSSDNEARSSFLQSAPNVHLRLIKGTRLGDFEILSLLGSGGMGEVYRARDRRLDRDVAIKVLPRFISFDSKRLWRFEQEAKAAAALNHPNILAVFQMGTYEDAPYLVSELLEGETLREQVKCGPLSLRRAIDYGVQVAHGLAAAHEKGIVHRDLKPENLFITREGRVKILDFGLAKLTHAESETQVTKQTLDTEPGAVLGTVGYMSPEQVRGEPADHRSDIFALGAILFEMAAGRRAFSGNSPADVMSAILNQEPPEITAERGDIAPSLKRILSRCLEKSTSQRFQSALDVAFALDTISGVTEEVASSTRKIQKPGTALAISAGFRWVIVLGVVAIAGLAFAYWRYSAVQPPRVLSYTQITHDSHRKHATGSEQTGSVTDGPRVFFTEGAGDNGLIPHPAQVSSGGGETVPLPVPFDASVILDISASASELLVASFSNNSDTDHALWAVPVLGGSPRRLANVKSLFAAWSPDGKKLVYAEGSDLYLASNDGIDPHKLVTVPGIPGWVVSYIPGWPRWSPDASRIRFSVQDPRTLSYAIWEVSADGSNLHPLLPGWNNPPAECCGVWSPDGKYFIFQSTRNGRTDLWAMREKVNSFQQGGRRPVQLTAGPMNFLGPNSSRDGTKLFTLGIQSKNELVRYDAGTKQLVRYLSGISAEGADFSKDGQWVTYVAIPQGTLWRSKPDGSERMQLSFPPLQVALPRWSPDGRQIVFMGRLPPQLWQIYVVPAEGGSPQQLVSDDENEGEPDWSPNGSQLVFSQFPQLGSAARDMVIHRLDLRTHQVSILPGSEGLYSARWSSDGRYIAASTVDNSKLMASELATRKWTTVSQPGGRILGWSRNDEYIYYENDGTFYRANVRHRYSEQVASLRGIQRGTGILGFLSWSALVPNGSILLMREASSEEIYALALEWP